ncbi:hypothetical protein HZB01_05185, partial [Candidatus Woesearchaeota archaeon]|nr:hypothetical protein [Candidatus Woesearchaeota archaeon]
NTANPYALAVGEFVRDRCNGCQDIVIVGDDYVVPQYRHTAPIYLEYKLLWDTITNVEEEVALFTDQVYIPETTNLTNVESIFKEDLLVIVPESNDLDTEFNVELQNLLTSIQNKYGHIPVIREDTQYNCRSHDLLKQFNLLIITTENHPNKLVNCFGIPEIIHNNTLYFKRNVFSNEGKKALIISPEKVNYIDSLPGEVAYSFDTLLAFEELITDPVFSSINTAMLGPFGMSGIHVFTTHCFYKGKYYALHPTGPDFICAITPGYDLAVDHQESASCVYKQNKRCELIRQNGQSCELNRISFLQKSVVGDVTLYTDVKDYLTKVDNLPDPQYGGTNGLIDEGVCSLVYLGTGVDVVSYATIVGAAFGKLGSLGIKAIEIVVKTSARKVAEQMSREEFIDVVAGIRHLAMNKKGVAYFFSGGGEKISESEAKASISSFLKRAKGIEAGDKTRITTLTVHFGEKQVYAGLLGEADAYDAVKGLKVIEDSGLQIGEYLPELPASYRLNYIRMGGKGYDIFKSENLVRAELEQGTALFRGTTTPHFTRVTLPGGEEVAEFTSTFTRSLSLETDLYKFILKVKNREYDKIRYVYISTSKEFGIANDFATDNGFIYLINPRSKNVIDIVESTKAKGIYMGDIKKIADNQVEFAYIGEIPKEDIVGVFVKDNGQVTKFLRNKNYLGDIEQFRVIINQHIP